MRRAALIANLPFAYSFYPCWKNVGSPQSNIARGRLFILSAAILWSLAGVFIKFLDVPPLTIVFYRSFFAFLAFTAFVRRADWQINGPVLISVLTYTAAISSFVSANKLTTAANAIVLQYTAPIFVFFFSRLVLGEKISRMNGFALLAGMIGVGVISLDSAGEPEMAGVCSGARQRRAVRRVHDQPAPDAAGESDLSDLDQQRFLRTGAFVRRQLATGADSESARSFSS